MKHISLHEWFGALLLGMLGPACGGATASRGELDNERFTSSDAERARRLAPDLVARAEQQRAEATRLLEAGEPLVWQDHATAARLWLDAAIVEAQRVELEERRLSLEAETEQADESFARLTAERRELEAEARRQQAAEVARQVAERVLADGGPDGQGRRTPSAETRRQAIDVLSTRARLLLAAAQAMGATPTAVAPIEQLLAQAVAQRGVPGQALVLADRALQQSQLLLGQVRRNRPGATPEETATLVAEARELGWSAEHLERGLTVRMRSTPPSLVRVASLIQAHPHGPVGMQTYAPAARADAARARAQRIIQGLVAAGVPAERLTISEPLPSVRSEDNTAIEIVFPAYSNSN